MSKAFLAVLLCGLATVASAQQKDSTPAQSDSAFRELQRRGQAVMGVDQYTSVHRFESLPDGGRIELQRQEDDSAGIETIRRHLKDIAAAFRSGDFRNPAMVHDMTVPGTEVMTRKKDRIRYEFRQLSRGGEVRITTNDPEAVAAVHEFLAFQRMDHRTGQTHQH